MPRETLHYWFCWRGHQNPPGARACACGARRVESYAQVREAERAVIYQHPLTGERRTPARADQPMPEVYAARGFERREIMSMSSFERETGLVHEASNFAPGNEPVSDAHPLPRRDPKILDELARDLAAAQASGPWTGLDRLSDNPDPKP